MSKNPNYDYKWQIFDWEKDLFRKKENWKTQIKTSKRWEESYETRDLIKRLHKIISRIKKDSYEFLIIFVKSQIDSYNNKIPMTNATQNICTFAIAICSIFISVCVWMSDLSIEIKEHVFTIIAVFMGIAVLIFVVFILILNYKTHISEDENKDLFFYQTCLHIIESLEGKRSCGLDVKSTEGEKR